MKKIFSKLFGKRNTVSEKEFLTVSDKELTIPERFSKWINKIESGNLPSDEIKGLNF